MSNLKEIWVSVKGFNNYQISNTGKIRNSFRELKPQKMTSGYLFISLRRDNKTHFNSMHRLVASHFIENNDENKKEVNHINGDKHDNRAENLEWVSHSDNIKHSYYSLNRKKSKAQLGKKGSLHHLSKKVKCLETDKIYESINLAAIEFNLHPANIIKVCKGKAKTCGGYKWKYI